MVGGSNRTMNQHQVIGRENWSMDDVKVTILKENKKIKLKGK